MAHTDKLEERAEARDRMGAKYINGGKELIRIKDRAQNLTPFRKSKRWIIWNETTQTVIGEHSTQRDAQAAFDYAK
jgi:hypothetical protein